MSEEKVSRFSGKKLAIGSAAAAFGVLAVVVALLYVVTTPLPLRGCGAVYRGPLRRHCRGCC